MTVWIVIVQSVSLPRVVILALDHARHVFDRIINQSNLWDRCPTVTVDTKITGTAMTASSLLRKGIRRMLLCKQQKFVGCLPLQKWKQSAR
jgi:hypothetical protein